MLSSRALRLLPPLQLNGRLHLTLAGLPGATSLLEVSPDRQQWSLLRAVNLGPGTVLVMEPMAGPCKFYRAMAR